MLPLILASCVSKKSFNSLQEERDMLNDRYNKLASKCQEEKSTYSSAAKANQDKINKLESQLENEQNNSKRLTEQVDFLKKRSPRLLISV